MVGPCGGVVRAVQIDVICMGIDLGDLAEDIHVLLLFDLFVCLVKRLCMHVCWFAVCWWLWGGLVYLCSVPPFLLYIMEVSVS